MRDSLVRATRLAMIAFATHSAHALELADLGAVGAGVVHLSESFLRTGSDSALVPFSDFPVACATSSQATDRGGPIVLSVVLTESDHIGAIAHDAPTTSASPALDHRAYTLAMHARAGGIALAVRDDCSPADVAPPIPEPSSAALLLAGLILAASRHRSTNSAGLLRSQSHILSLADKAHPHSMVVIAQINRGPMGCFRTKPRSVVVPELQQT